MTADGPALLVSLPDDKLLVMPGGLWDAHCGDSDPRILFRAVTASPDSVFEASLEISDLTPNLPFDEREYLRALTGLIAHRSENQGYVFQDLGSVSLTEPHSGHVIRLDRPAHEQPRRTSVHGYAARLLRTKRVLLLHVSESSSAKVASGEFSNGLLPLYGDRSELLE